jgi:hypothetical protein
MRSTQIKAQAEMLQEADGQMNGKQTARDASGEARRRYIRTSTTTDIQPSGASTDDARKEQLLPT